MVRYETSFAELTLQTFSNEVIITLEATDGRPGVHISLERYELVALANELLARATALMNPST